jgi:hypothetical protein
MLRFLVLATILFAFGLIGCGNEINAKVSGVTATTTIKSFMPENDLANEDGFVAGNNMTEERFNEIIDSVVKYYEPIVSDLGGNLVVNRNWDDSTVNAYADRNDGNWNVSMFGGLARRQEISDDGFAMVIAHEIGHHIAGYPFVRDWASDEGNSDTFSTGAAGKLIWGNEDNSNIAVHPTAKDLCDKYASDRNLCYREMNAGYSLARLLGALGGTKVSFDTPDKSIVKKTAHEHPKAQCRLDTYVAATLCDVKWNNGLIPQNAAEMAKSSCMSASKTDYDIRARPRCWFAPK